MIENCILEYKFSSGGFKMAVFYILYTSMVTFRGL